MIEALEARTNDALGISIGEKGIFKGSLGRVTAAACPECGSLVQILPREEVQLSG